MSDKPKRTRKPRGEQQLKPKITRKPLTELQRKNRMAKLKEQIKNSFEELHKLRLTKENVLVLIDVLENLEMHGNDLSEPNWKKLNAARGNSKPCVLWCTVEEITNLKEIFNSGKFDGRGFKDVIRSGLKGANSLAKAGGYKHGISDAILSETVGRMVPGSERYTDAISGYADKRIKGMGFMNGLKRGAKLATKGIRVANDISEGLGYGSIGDIAMDKANEYIPEEYQGVTNAVGKYAKKRLSGGAIHNPYMPRNLHGGSINPSPMYETDYLNEPQYTGVDEEYFAPKRGRGFRSY